MIYIKRKTRTAKCFVCGSVERKKKTLVVGDINRVTASGGINTNFRLVLCDECRRKARTIKETPHLPHGGIKGEKTSPVIVSVTLNQRNRRYWAARVLLMAAGFTPDKTPGKFTIRTGIAAADKWLKANCAGFPLVTVTYTDIATGREIKTRDRDKLGDWLDITQRKHGSDTVTVLTAEGVVAK